MKKEKSFQEHFPGNICFGCGPANKRGIHVTKSYWVGPDHKETICNWRIRKFCTATTRGRINGAIQYALMDCHSIWTAIAARYDFEKRPFASDPVIMYVTGGSDYVKYLKPIPIDSEIITVLARVEELKTESRRCTIFAELVVKGVICAEARFFAVRVEPDPNEIHALLYPPKK
ncbi:hypothetical protein A2W54_03475 [Candidatus Giovannonibacteria bacterium RIFCSPHIGHO2_02_43_13]|uniref:Thioesterase domain-containing protein n=1 Tax=Candidatus Giovannonibacteria bacterium RIFCSPHIGHO2_02_43_13 TaxID=1798330 RepID=A0A1F5WQA1_9BACT|nr:MAG: hypothetical protein A3E06_00685 [Candidatus Giovannonibacteria bacterium RIFCSPHIGHO2_12_FULL_44_42]OGF77836.1 MAG: hypothetical protein A2W54_03475 [Candidatus Giovannonibacteria bacterium RIFCSPHIGHO2_02_43_13]OGF88828.1 MAG: hypothetical protein A3I94_02380 [Candidatus Giovannonibacteria bacterium RIFCSPLOWO2_02_FULL_43_54]OGF96792.1 MAG: hypothetical protein A3H08_01270 [Candidatus Giovannonibacteria bacterium RIFCSPLOWO2_12_FULL_44_32]